MPDSLPPPALDRAVLDRLFLQARTYNAFTGEVDDALLRRLYDLLKFGPTQSNSCPARFVFVKSAAAKAKLGPALDQGNYAKTMAAPCTVIVAYDMAFYDKLPVLIPHTDGRGWFADAPEASLYRAALRSSSLQGAYLILAARALGLDCGPMSGFDTAKVDAAFFAGTAIRSNFLVNLGRGEASSVHPRAPRLGFDEACRIE
ncbi:malonic semialdehyde reductase [Cognatiluteimonas weifangensis]|uniref:Putative NADH dehydrogenase/NAD(P)H nitroreductase D0Y53_02340 n=1 Tax=Cognatiluteimonas weifangensis TaxID=2303539 RepID=A0A372DQU0_9GAMM|nr:malonic semialdehyde reductase [Luteimonas weifangensis]RFP61919.1 malonic semialdehyde reductase [Luteimonas weifangensis]